MIDPATPAAAPAAAVPAQPAPPVQATPHNPAAPPHVGPAEQAVIAPPLPTVQEGPPPGTAVSPLERLYAGVNWQDFAKRLQTEGDVAFQELLASVPDLALSADEAEELRFATHQLLIVGVGHIGLPAAEAEPLHQAWLDAKAICSGIAAMKAKDGEVMFQRTVARVFARATDFVLSGFTKAAVVAVLG